MSVQNVFGEPPSRYLVTYCVNGIAWDAEQGRPYAVAKHVVDITLPLGYPKQSPRCVMHTPIWHPNIGEYVCIGDFWSAGVTLVNIIAHIGDMIQYRSYNLQSPVSKEAATWAQRNLRSFPLGTKDIIPPDHGAKPVVITPVNTATSDFEISLGPIKSR